MRYEFFETKVVNSWIEIEDPGNCAIKALNETHQAYYLVTKTDLGVTTIFEYGPSVENEELLPKTVNCSFKRISYTDKKIDDAIEKFLNNPTRSIISATLMDREDALLECRPIIEYVKDGGQ